MWKKLATVSLAVSMVCYMNILSAQQRNRQKIDMRFLKMHKARLIENSNNNSEDGKPDENQYADSAWVENSMEPDEDLNDLFIDKIDTLVNMWHIKEMFDLEPLEEGNANTYPKNISDSVYVERLKNIQEVVDLSYNKVVKNFIVLYTEKRRDLTEVLLGLSAYYFPMFEEILDKNNMPLELKYLPVIESALNPRAFSRAGASGLWQFMYGTGKQMKLNVTSFVDERRDPVKSTEAAAEYFKYLYKVYGDWNLAIAGYNCGPGNVNKAIRRSGNKRNYWKIYYRLPRETRGYVPAFIAVAYVMNYYKEHNLRPRLPEFPIMTDTVMVYDYLHFNQVEAVIGVDKEQLRELNPMFRRDVIPATQKKSYPLVIPKEKIYDFIDVKEEVFAYERGKYFPDNMLVKPSSRSANYYTPTDIKGKEKVFYTVKSGDNVGFISSWFNVRAADLRYWNNIRRNLIRVGQKLVIYVPENQKGKYERISKMSFAQKQAGIGKNVNPTNSNSEKVKEDPNYDYYIVKKGDTIWDIAKKHSSVSTKDILRLNNLTNRSTLSIGQKIKIRNREEI